MKNKLWEIATTIGDSDGRKVLQSCRNEEPFTNYVSACDYFETKCSSDDDDDDDNRSVVEFEFTQSEIDADGVVYYDGEIRYGKCGAELFNTKEFLAAIKGFDTIGMSNDEECVGVALTYKNVIKTI